MNQKAAQGGQDALRKSKTGKPDDDDNRAAMHVSSKNEGISLSFFKKNCSFLAGCLSDIVERILVANGLDIESSNAVITWEAYLQLYCIFEAGKMEKSALIKFWERFFDKGLKGFV